MKKEYESPEIWVEEFEIENPQGNLCSGIDPIIDVGLPGYE